MTTEPETRIKMFTMNEVVDAAADSLKNLTNVGDLFESAQKIACDFMEMRFIAEVRDLVSEFTAPENPAHTTKENIEKVVRLHDYSDVDPEGEEYETLLKTESFKERIVRQIIRATIAKEDNKLDLSPTERIFLEKGTRIQDVFDRLHLKWRREVLHGKGFEELRRLQKIYEETCKIAGKPKSQIDEQYAYKHFFHDVLGPQGDFLYVMPRLNSKGEIIGVPYAQAFADEIFGDEEHTGLVTLMDEMNEELALLEPLDANAEGLMATNTALKKLLTCKESPVKQNELAIELDRVWVQDAPATGDNANTVRILYPMESYFDPGKKLVEFEYNLLFVDKRHTHLNQLVNTAKHESLTFLSEDERFQKFETLKRSLPVMRDCDARFYDILRSGTSLGFKSAASNVPNIAEIRLLGTIINMDYSTFVERSEIAHELLDKIIDNKQKQQYFVDREKELEMLAIFVGLHEIGHNAFVVKDSMTRLTNPIYSNLEEAKSDIFALTTALSYLKGKDREAFVATIFSASLRGITRWQEYDDRTHFHGDAMRLQLLLDTKILSKENGQWTFDASDEKIQDFWNRATDILLDFAEVYETRDSALAQEKARMLMTNYFVESDLLKELAEDAEIDTSPQE